MMQPLAAGQRIGAYAIDGRVGEGGMGAVYRARDTSLGRAVALKVIRTSAEDGPSADTIARFLREARLGASLSHPNIVVVYEAGAFGDVPYLAMEWVDGRSLDKLVRDPSCTLSQRIEILDAVADALAYAHGHGVIHRDVKPTNVMIDTRGRARLVDFGIAKRTGNFAPGTMMLPTHARQVLGTPAYMAPEQMLSAAVDARADQFSWGVLAFELLGGAHPNATVPEDGPPFPVAKPKPLHWQRPDVPEALAAIVHRAMSYEPGGRFGSMDEVLAAWRAAKPVAGASGAYGALAGSQYGPAPAQTTMGGTHATATSYAPPPQQTTPWVQPSHPALPMHQGSFAPPPQRLQPERRFPWIAVIAIVGSLLLVAGVGIALLVTLNGGAASAAGGGGSPGVLPASPLSLGPKKAQLESFEDLKFAPPQPDVAKAKAAVEAKITPCFAASSVAKEEMFKATIDATADGRITKVTELEVCKEQHPSFYLCTERGNTPKKGYPSVPDDVFACLERALLSTRLPPVVVEKGKQTSSADLDIHVQ